MPRVTRHYCTITVTILLFLLLVGMASPAAGAITLSTNKTSYVSLEQVVVYYSGLAGNPGDYITIVPTTAADSVLWEWHATAGATSGNMTFLEVYDPGTYEARLHLNNNGNVVSARSPSFTVSYPNTQLLLDKPAGAYTSLDTITVSYSSAAGYAGDYITVVPANSPDNTWWEYYKTYGKTADSMVFTNPLDPGIYEARYHPNNDDNVVYRRVRFTIAFPATQLSLDKKSYTWQDPIGVGYSAAPGYYSDYVTVSPAASLDDYYGEYDKTGLARTGSFKFTNVIDPGVYEARFHPNDNDPLVTARARFVVSLPATTIGTDSTTYAANTPVTVTYSTATAYSKDYVTIVAANANDGDYNEWHYTTGLSGTLKFTQNLGAGVYEARFMPNNSNFVSARARFIVGAVAPAPAIALSPTATVDLSAVAVLGSGSASLLVSNIGNAALNITGATVTGNAMFSASTPSSIAAGQSATLTITFKPTSSGPQSATLTIASNDPIHPSVKVALIGLGTVPALTGTNLIKSSDAEVITQAGACTSAATAFAPWTTDGVALVCPYGSEFATTTPGPSAIDRGGFYFRGGVAATASITQTIDVSANASLINSGTSYTLAGWLGGIGSDGDNATLTATFRNASGGQLGTGSIGPVLNTDRDNNTGLIFRGINGTVPAGTTSVLLTLAFTRQAGQYDEGSADNLYFAIAGAAAPTSPPYISTSVNSLNFGTVTVGQSSQQTFTISNSGGGTLRIDTLSVTPAGPFSILSPTASASSPLLVPPTATVTVQFNPTAAGAQSAMLNITDYTNYVTSSFTISGTGVTSGSGGNCSYNFPATSTISGSAANNVLLFQLLTSPTCTWSVTSPSSWITIAAPSAGSSVTGSSAVSVNVQSNPSSTTTRIGQVTVTWPNGSSTQSANHTVTQNPSCAYSLSPTSATAVSNAGGTGTFTVATGATCTWTAVASPTLWIGVTSPTGAATGPGTVAFTVQANSTPGAPSRNGTITVQDQTFAITQNAAPPVGPAISSGGVLNAASNAPASPPNGGVAQGSYISIYGSLLGPNTWVYAPGGATLAATLGGVSIKLTNGSTAVDVLPTFVAPSQINAIIPSNAPLGIGQLTVTYNGVTSPPFPVNILAHAPGVFTLGATSTAGIIQTFSPGTPDNLRAVNGPTATAAAGDWGIIWSTGLGPNIVLGQLQPDNQPPPGGMLDLDVAVTVTVNGIPAIVGYKGRAPGFPGVDNIYFTVPNGVPNGCAIPVVLTAGAATANQVTIAINSQHSSCQ